MDKLSYRCHRFLSIVIQQAVWLYFRFALSYRDVEDMLADSDMNRAECASDVLLPIRPGHVADLLAPEKRR